MKRFLIHTQLQAIILFMVFMFYSMQGITQQASTDLPTYHPVSPNAASLGNYGLYPVNKNLGKAAVNIPIYNLSFKSLNVPISISYNTSGIRLNDIASWVGLGWTLNSGGAIIRNTKGLPDLSFTSSITDLADPDFNSTNFYHMKEACVGWEDTEPDQYVINALGITGSFYLDQNSNHEVEFEDASIAIQIDPVSNDEIHAILEDGTLLIFGKGSDNSDATELTDSNLEYSYTTSDFITTWYLTELISSNRMDTVSFRYIEVSPGGMYQEYAKPESERAYVDGSGTPAIGVNPNWQLSETERKYLDKIIYSNGYVEFETSANRDDLEDDYQLDAIKVYEVDDNGFDMLIDQYHFVYDYYLRSGGIYSTNYSFNVYFNTDQQEDSREKSLRLLEMYRGSTTGTKHKHQFSYNSTQLKKRCTTAQDFWGYCNGNTGTLIPQTTVSLRSNWTTNYVTLGNGSRTVSESYMKAGVLETIIYPTGGYTEFEFEANETATDLVGGLRIKSISNYDDAMASYPASKKTFTYELPNLIQPLGNKSYEREYIINIPNFDITDTHVLVSSSPHFNNNLGGEPVIEYGKVTEFEYSEASDEYNGKTISYYENITNDQVLNGSVSFNLFQHDDYEITSDLVNSLLDEVLSGLIDKNYFETKSWKRGRLTKEETYKMNGSSYVMIKSVENTYETIETDTMFNNFVYSPWEIPFTIWDVADPYTVNGDHCSLQYCYYEGKTVLGRKALEQTVVKDYDQNGSNPVTTTTECFYDNDTHLQLTRTHTSDSKGDRLISITRYPDDVASSTSLTGGNLDVYQYAGINEMKWGEDFPQINKPIQREVYRDYDNDQVADANELLSVQRTAYKEWGSTGIQPESISSLKGAVSPTNQLEDRVEFHGYDSDGNPDEISRANDIHTSYIWGYRNQYPIVKADNISQSSLVTATAAAINSLTGYSGGLADLDELLWDVEGFILQSQRDTWASFNSSLRSQTALADASVSTYNYYPHIGLSSQTDPNGNTTYYSYDDFNRLEKVKDKDNAQVQSYEYNYKPIELSISPASLEFTSSASNESASVTATQSWTVSDNQSWITVSPTSGSGDDDITVSVSANTSGSSRDGTVTLSDNSGLGLLSKTISVHQADVPSITLSASTVDLYGDSDSDQVTVTSNISWSYYVDYWDDYAWLQINRTNSGFEYNATLDIAANRAPTSGSWEAQIVIQGGGLTRYINVTVYP